MVDYGLDRTCLIALKGNITFHKYVKVYEHDYKYTAFKNVLVKVKEEGLLFTYKKNDELIDYVYDYLKVWRIETEGKEIFNINTDSVLLPRFKSVHVMPGDNYYVVDTEGKWNERDFGILPVDDEEAADELAGYLNYQEDKINMLLGYYNLYNKPDGDVELKEKNMGD